MATDPISGEAFMVVRGPRAPILHLVHGLFSQSYCSRYAPRSGWVPTEWTTEGRLLCTRCFCNPHTPKQWRGDWGTTAYPRRGPHSPSRGGD